MQHLPAGRHPLACMSAIGPAAMAGRRPRMRLDDRHATDRRPAKPCPGPRFPLHPRRDTEARARSSAGEHYVDIVGVTGSIPVAPTNLFKGLDYTIEGQPRRG